MTTIPDLPVRVLTVKQPWAWAIIHSDPKKDIENRQWKPAQPFFMLVHAGQKTDFDAFRFMRRRGIKPPLTSQLTYGAIIGAVTVRLWSDYTRSPWADPDSKWHWLLEDAVAFAEPLHCRGQMGLFKPPVNWRSRIG